MNEAWCLVASARRLFRVVFEFRSNCALLLRTRPPGNSPRRPPHFVVGRQARPRRRTPAASRSPCIESVIGGR